MILKDIEVAQKRFKSRRIISDDGTLKDTESIYSIASFGSNLYVGTSFGQLLHYHRFDDTPDFILISQQTIRSSPITKILIMAKSERVVVLCGSILNMYSLPELSPTQSGKLKEVEDISLFQESDLVVVTPDKIRLIRFIQNEVKLLKSIPVSSIIRAVSHNKYLTVATDKEYKLISIQDASVVPLFQYTEGGSRPNIIPYRAKDSRKEEILLTVEADNHTTMGMFISDGGEPTRGTLPFIEKGYPVENSEVVVDWPYALGVFPGKFIIASLIDFEIKSEQDVDSQVKLAYLPNQTVIQDDLYEVVGQSEATISSTIVVYDSHTVSLFYEESRITKFQQALASFINGDIEEIQLLEGENDKLYNQLLFIYLIWVKKYDTLSNLMDDTFNDIMVNLYNNTPKRLYKGVQEICDLVRDKLDKDFKGFALNRIRTSYLESHDNELKILAYSGFQSDQEFINFSNRDKLAWANGMEEIVSQLGENGLFLAQLHSYVLLNHSEEICLMCTKFLTGELEKGSDEAESKAPDNSYFIDLILSHLDKVDDSKVYRQSLLEVLRIDSKKGIQYMKKNVNGKHKSTHNEVLKLSTTVANNEDFAHLKLEVIENEYKDGRASTLEILDHLLTMLRFPNEVATNNFMILYQTFLIENTFDNHKPITSWVQFLQSVKDTTECKEFILVYLKTFELLNFHGLETDSIKKKVSDLLEIDTYDYFKCSIVAEEKIARLLEFKDYVAAEYYCIYDRAPYPTTKYFLNTVVDEKSSRCNEQLLIVFDRYKEDKNLHAMRHFINSYGPLFKPIEVLDMLPPGFPIAYAQDYFTDLFINLEGRHRLLVLKKIFNKQEAKTNKELYTHVFN